MERIIPICDEVIQFLLKRSEEEGIKIDKAIFIYETPSISETDGSSVGFAANPVDITEEELKQVASSALMPFFVDSMDFDEAS